MEVLDSEPEAVFDALASAAATLSSAPIALITVVDEHRQWFKSAFGLTGITETPRDIAFCAYAILGRDVLEIGDTANDERFVDNPLVTGPQHFRFYAGAPIVLTDGVVVGTLCVIDRVPRRLTAPQRDALMHLAAAAARTFDVRERAVVSPAPSEVTGLIDRVHRATPVPLCSIDGDARLLTVNDRWLSETGYERGEVLGRAVSRFFTAPSRSVDRPQGIPIPVHTGDTDGLECGLVCKDGTSIDVLVWSRLERDDDGAPLRSICMFENITPRRGVEEALRASRALLARVGDLAGVGGWDFDFVTGAISWSDTTCRLHDAGPGFQPTIESVLGLYAYPSRVLVADALRTSMIHGTPIDLQLPLQSMRGRAMWGHVVGSVEFEAGVPRRLVGAFQDVTCRKQMESELARSRALLLATLEATPPADRRSAP